MSITHENKKTPIFYRTLVLFFIFFKKFFVFYLVAILPVIGNKKTAYFESRQLLKGERYYD